MKKAVIYARYSCEKQTEQSIEGQMRVCYDFALRNDIQIVGEYIDRAQSGTNDKRTQFKRMMSDSMRQLWDYIIVYKLDRFSRNKYEMAVHRKTLRDNNIKIISAMENIPDTPEGIILESLLEGMAEYYSAELSQKVKRGMKENRLKGFFTGGPIMFGYKIVDKKVVACPEEAHIVIKIFEDYLNGKPVTQIVEDLNNQKLISENRVINDKYIYYMLKNEKYIGKTTYDGEVFENIFPAIVPTPLFNAVQERTKHYTDYRGKGDYMLKGIVKCGLCGSNYISDSGTSSTGELHRYYKCSLRKRKNKCHSFVFPKKVLEDIVAQTTEKLFKRDQLSKLADKVLEHHRANVTKNNNLDLLYDRRKKLQSMVDNLMEYAAQTGDTSEHFINKLNCYKDGLQGIEVEIAKEQIYSSCDIEKSDVLTFIKTTLKQSPDLLYHSLINKIVIFQNKIEITYNYVGEKLRPVTTTKPTSIYAGTYSYRLNRGAIIVPNEEVTIEIDAKIE